MVGQEREDERGVACPPLHPHVFIHSLTHISLTQFLFFTGNEAKQARNLCAGTRPGVVDGQGGI
jgi:hypothetical protein